ncbi:MAG: hypothetical protein V1652_00480 [bacterium]
MSNFLITQKGDTHMFYTIIWGFIILLISLVGWIFYRYVSTKPICNCENCLKGDPFFAGQGPCLWKELEEYFKDKSKAARAIQEFSRQRGILMDKELEILWKGNKLEIKEIQKKIKKISQRIEKKEKIIIQNLEDKMEVMMILHKIQ